MPTVPAAHIGDLLRCDRTAHDADAAVSLDDDALNPTYAYEDDNHRKHIVWFLDAATLFNQVKVSDPYRPMGYALWRMGAEDPAVWRYFHQPYGSAQPVGLEAIAPGVGVDFDGTGEVLHVDASPKGGLRSIETDPETGLISGEVYHVMPTSYVIDRYGAHPGWVALTFDDGPDGRWTPKILDIRRPSTPRPPFSSSARTCRHGPRSCSARSTKARWSATTPGPTPISPPRPSAQTDLEINTTQRLFSVLTGRSMRFFRPPYFGDAEPSTPGEVEPLKIAQSLGYLIVGLRIDPDDWKKPATRGDHSENPGPAGGHRPHRRPGGSASRRRRRP